MTQRIQVTFVLILISFFSIRQFLNQEFYTEFSYTQKFLCDIAPLVILICGGLGITHYYVNKHLGSIFNGKQSGFARKSIALSFLLGCTNLLLLIKGEKVKLNFSERFILLSICFASAGGLTCLSLSVLGFPAYQLILASLLSPIYIYFFSYLIVKAINEKPTINPRVELISSPNNRVSEYLFSTYLAPVKWSRIKLS